MVSRNVKAGRLQFTTSLESCLNEVEVVDVYKRQTQKIALESQMFTYRSVLTPVAGEEYAYVILPSVAQVSR